MHIRTQTHCTVELRNRSMKTRKSAGEGMSGGRGNKSFKHDHSGDESSSTPSMQTQTETHTSTHHHQVTIDEVEPDFAHMRDHELHRELAARESALKLHKKLEKDQKLQKIASIVSPVRGTDLLLSGTERVSFLLKKNYENGLDATSILVRKIENQLTVVHQQWHQLCSKTVSAGVGVIGLGAAGTRGVQGVQSTMNSTTKSTSSLLHQLATARV